MSRSGFAGFVVIAAVAAVAACSTEPSAEGIETTESLLTLPGVAYLGNIENGQMLSGRYDGPAYRAYGFDASGGEDIVAEVTAESGQITGYITDER